MDQDIYSKESSQMLSALEKSGTLTNPFPMRVIEAGVLEGQRHDEELIGIIQEDPRLTAQVLRRVNSAYYRRGAAVDSIEEAIVRLGYSMIREILLTCFIDGFYHEHPVPKEKATVVRNIFDHSIATAWTARCIVPWLLPGEKHAATAFTAGLLHHLGLYLMTVRMKDYEEAVIQRMKDLKGSWVDAEQSLYGTTHAETGGMLLKLWDLPESIHLSVGWHHRAAEVSESPLGLDEVVRIASVIANTPEKMNPVPILSRLSPKMGAWGKTHEAEILKHHESLGGIRGSLHHLCETI